MIEESRQLVEMAMAYSRSRVLCAAARLRIADALATGEQTVPQLAKVCGANPSSLHRLLRVLASIGIVVESAPGTFALAPLGQPLRRDVPHSAWSAVVFWSDLLADNSSHLTECVRTGDTVANVMERAGLPSRWSQDPDAGAVFRAVMGTGSHEQYAAIADSWDFSGHRTIADLGGGGGSLLMAILRKLPHLNGMLVDQPASIESASPRFEQESLSLRCRLFSGDLLEAVPGGADVYILKHVLHGYDDGQAVRILKNCQACLPADGRLLIIEFVLPAVVNRVDSGLERCLMSDLNMLAVTGGKERTAAEWAALIERAGLQLLRTLPVSEDPASIIETSRRSP